MIAMASGLRRGLLLVLAVASLLAAAVLLASERVEAAANLFQDDATVELYAQNCAPCHGPSGEGGVGPSLQQSAVSLADQVVIITIGEGGMPSFGVTLSAEQIEDLAAYSVALQQETSDTTAVDLAADGAQVYAASCATCHGVDGEGGAGPNLKETDLTRDDLAAVVRDGRGTMPGFAGVITADEVGAVVAFMEELASAASGPAVGPDSAVVAEGARLFTNNCSQCHGPDASGGEGPALKASTLTDGQMVSVISNGRGAMPGFSGILSTDTIDALVAYVDATRAAAGTEFSGAEATLAGFDIYVSACATCHALDGSGGLGPSLANTDLTTNEVISHVFGGHPGDMPAFEGVLDATQVRDVAQYVVSIEGTRTSQVPWAVFVVAAIIVVTAMVSLWYWGVLEVLWHRLRLRRSAADRAA